MFCRQRINTRQFYPPRLPDKPQVNTYTDPDPFTPTSCTNPDPINKSTSTQRVRHHQVTASQRQRAEETVDIMETWADGAHRQDKAEEEWDALRCDVQNPNLHDFQKLLEKEVTLALKHLHPHHRTLTPSPFIHSGTRRHCKRSMRNCSDPLVRCAKHLERIRSQVVREF